MIAHFVPGGPASTNVGTVRADESGERSHQLVHTSEPAGVSGRDGPRSHVQIERMGAAITGTYFAEFPTGVGSRLGRHRQSKPPVRGVSRANFGRVIVVRNVAQMVCDMGVNR